MSLYRPSLELPEVRHFRPNFVDSGDGTKKLDPMLACRVVVIKWVAQFTHLTRNATSGTNVTEMEQVKKHFLTLLKWPKSIFCYLKNDQKF